MKRDNKKKLFVKLYMPQTVHGCNVLILNDIDYSDYVASFRKWNLFFKCQIFYDKTHIDI